MKSKFTTIIISFVLILITCIIVIFGMIFYQEIQKIQSSAQPEEFQSIISSGETIDKDIETPKILENPLNNITNNTDKNVEREVDYSNISIDKYFYNQLNNYEKTIYKAFESNKENMKAGTYKVEFGSAFSEILKKENGQDELGRYYQSAIEAYTYDNPDVFYLSPNKMYLNIETTTRGSETTYYVYMDNGNENNYLIDEFSSKEEINLAISKLEQIKNSAVQSSTGNTYNDIKMVHDYLINNIEYDTTISKQNIYNIYGALINHEAVCEGYARAFKYLMDGLGIPCTLVIGVGTNSEGRTENHAWNYVQISGSWYAIDCTWDDPVVTGVGWISESSKYKYFLKGSRDMDNDHKEKGQFTEGGKKFSYPTLSSNNYE